MKMEGVWKAKGEGNEGDRRLQSTRDNAVSRGYVLPRDSSPSKASPRPLRAPRLYGHVSAGHLQTLRTQYCLHHHAMGGGGHVSQFQEMGI